MLPTLKMPQNNMNEEARHSHLRVFTQGTHRTGQPCIAPDKQGFAAELHVDHEVTKSRDINTRQQER